MTMGTHAVACKACDAAKSLCAIHAVTRAPVAAARAYMQGLDTSGMVYCTYCRFFHDARLARCPICHGE